MPRHIVTAIGSAAELETQLEAAIRLKFIGRDRAQPLATSLDRLQKLLYGMRRHKHQRLGISVATGVLAALVLLRLT